jgi:hypothetical protein
VGVIEIAQDTVAFRQEVMRYAKTVYETMPVEHIFLLGLFVVGYGDALSDVEITFFFTIFKAGWHMTTALISQK